MLVFCRKVAGERSWRCQQGGFPLNELFIVAVMIIVLLAAGIFGLVTGHWIALKGVAALLVVLIAASLVFGFFEDLGYSRNQSGLYDELVRFLQLAAEDADPQAVDEAADRVLDHQEFPSLFRRRGEELVALYRQVQPSQQARARSMLLKCIPFDTQALEQFLAIPVDSGSRVVFRHWLGCRPEALHDVLGLFQACLADESRNDQPDLSALLIGLSKPMPTPEYAEALRPLREHLEAAPDRYLYESDRETLERYQACWDGSG